MRGDTTGPDITHLYERIEAINETWRTLNQRHDLAKARAGQTAVSFDDETADHDAHQRSRFAQSVQDDAATRDNAMKAVMRLIPQHNVFRLTSYFATICVANLVAYTSLLSKPPMRVGHVPASHILSMLFSSLWALLIPLIVCSTFSHKTYKLLRSRNPKRYGLFCKIIVVLNSYYPGLIHFDMLFIYV